MSRPAPPRAAQRAAARQIGLEERTARAVAIVLPFVDAAGEDGIDTAGLVAAVADALPRRGRPPGSSAPQQTTDPDAAYVDVHRTMYGGIGERIATLALLARDRVLAPGFVLPMVRVAPVAPYGGCMALSGNGRALVHVDELSPGVWLYLHWAMYGAAERLGRRVDETVLHELIHHELRQAGRDPSHKGEPWAERCQELSRRLGISVSILRPRSVRLDRDHVTTATPDGCMPAAELASWPARLLDDGPSLRERLEGLAP